MRRLAAIVILVAARAAAAGSLPSHLGMFAPPPQGSQAEPTALAMLDSKIDVAMRGPIAELSIAQTFRNDSAAPTEATYIFPLPYDAAVTAMSIDVGARTIHAAIERRAQAQARYEDAIAHGVDAGLLEQERPDVFTQTVAAIPAHATVTVHLRVDALARYQDGTWELVVPLVVAPRFVPGSASGRPTVGSGRAPDTERSPDASRVTPAASPGAGGKTEIAIAFGEPVDGVTSPTHDVAQRGGRYVIASATSDRDAIIRWHSKVPAEGWLERDGDGGAGYAAVVVSMPPPTAARPNARAMLLVDRAATTLGDGELVEHALLSALADALTAGDQLATPSDGFLTASALRQALARDVAHHAPFDLTRELGKLHPQGAPVVLVTSGLVSDDAAAIAAARALGVPVHVIGFGPAPNRALLAALAGATGGTVRIAAVGDDLPALARGVLADIATPPQPFAVTWGTLAASAIVPALTPRVGAGQSLVVIARVAHVQPANARAAGQVLALATLGGGPTSPPPGATTTEGPLARRWARLELDELIAAGDRGAIAAHALAHGLVSPETSLVAIGEEVTTAGGVRHTRAVPVSLPAGMQWQDVKRETTVDDRVQADASEHEKFEEHAARQKQQKASPHAPPTTSAPAQPTSPPPPPVAAGVSPDVDEDHAADAKQPTHHKTPAPAADAGDDTGKGEVIEVEGKAPVIDQSSTAQGITIEEDYTKNIPVGRTYGDEITAAAGEAILVTDRRFVRLAAGLGGGLVAGRGGTGGLGALSARVDFGHALRFGVEGSLWLAGQSSRVQGDVALYASVPIARAFELVVGPALHVGGGVGPALDASLHYYLPWFHRVDVFLRADAGLLWSHGTDGVQSATAIGVEASW